MGYLIFEEGDQRSQSLGIAQLQDILMNYANSIHNASIIILPSVGHLKAEKRRKSV